MIVSLGARPRLCAAAVLAFAIAACSRTAGSNRSDSMSSAGAVAQPAESASTAATPSMVRGTVTAVSPTSVTVSTDSGASVAVALTPPVQVFERATSSLQNVKQNSFIGVTTVKQPGGAEQATEIHIFPEALRGLGEGSRMMTSGASSGGSGNRMTNGSVSSSSAGSGAAGSRMSNGSVASTNGSTMVVQYAGGSTTVTVPPNTPVTELKPASKQLAVGDQVAVLTSKNADGSLSSNRIMLTRK